MAITVDGELQPGVTAKDVILAIIGKIGTGGGIGHIIEYRGSTIRSLSMEGRMTVCNMSIEAGAKAGMIAPDDTTFAYVEGRPHAPKGALWEQALDDWRTLPTDEGAVFDREVFLDGAAIRPHVSWGTNPGQVVPIDGAVPHPDAIEDPGRARGRDARAALHGPRAGHADARDPGRYRVHRFLHEQPDRRSASRGLGRRRAQGSAERAGDGRARFDARARPGGVRRARSASSRMPGSNGVPPVARCAWV